MSTPTVTPTATPIATPIATPTATATATAIPTTTPTTTIAAESPPSASAIPATLATLDPNAPSVTTYEYRAYRDTIKTNKHGNAICAVSPIHAYLAQLKDVNASLGAFEKGFDINIVNRIKWVNHIVASENIPPLVEPLMREASVEKGLRAVLCKLGYATTTADSAERCVELLKNHASLARIYNDDIRYALYAALDSYTIPNTVQVLAGDLDFAKNILTLLIASTASLPFLLALCTRYADEIPMLVGPSSAAQLKYVMQIMMNASNANWEVAFAKNRKAYAAQRKKIDNALGVERCRIEEIKASLVQDIDSIREACVNNSVKLFAERDAIVEEVNLLVAASTKETEEARDSMTHMTKELSSVRDQNTDLRKRNKQQAAELESLRAELAAAKQKAVDAEACAIKVFAMSYTTMGLGGREDSPLSRATGPMYPTPTKEKERVPIARGKENPTTNRRVCSGDGSVGRRTRCLSVVLEEVDEDAFN